MLWSPEIMQERAQGYQLDDQTPGIRFGGIQTGWHCIIDCDQVSDNLQGSP